MPTYRVTDPNTNKTLRLTGDSPPTEQELNNIFSKVSSPEEVGGVGGAISREEFEQGRRNWIGQIERPGAAVRSAILGKSLKTGWRNPAEALPFSETFAEQEADIATTKALEDRGTLLGSKSLRDVKNFLDIYGADVRGRTAGMVTDILTDPVQLAIIAATKGLAKPVMGTKAGQAVGRFATIPVEETLPGRVIAKTGKIITKAPSKIAQPVKQVVKGIRSYKYATQAEPKTVGEEVIYRPKSVIELKPKLEEQAKIKYGEAIKGTQRQLEIEKATLKKSLDDLSVRTKSDIDKWKGQFKTDAQRGSIEGKRRFGQLTRENSDAYDSKLEAISNQLEKEGKSMTMDDLTQILDRTDTEIVDAYLGEGAPTKQIRLLREKFGLAPSEELNPEMALLAKKFPQMNFKNKGIDWSRAQIQGQEVSANQPLKFKEVLKEIRKVSKAMSAKAKGAERAFTDEDIAAAILKKHFGQWASENAPEFGNLQKQYSNLIEQMKVGRKIFKPGAKYDIATGSKFIEDIASRKADIREIELAQALQEGTPEFNRGLGQISQPAGKSLRKAQGIERGAEIAKKEITGKSLKSQSQIENEIVELQKALEARKAQLVSRKGVGSTKKVDLDELLKRSGYLARQKKIATAGGAPTVLDYGMRRAIFGGLFK